MQLADPRLGDTQDAADLGQRAVFQVVQAHHQLVALAELIDRLPQLPTGLVLLDGACRVGFGTGEGVEHRAVGTGAQLLDAQHPGRPGGAQLVQRHAERVGDLLSGRGPPQAHRELLADALGLPGAEADGARDPVLRAQLVEDRALDARHRVALEARAAAGVEPVDGLEQPEHPGLHEVGGIDVVGQPLGGPVRDAAHQRAVVHGQPIAGAATRRAAIGGPQVMRGGVPAHGPPSAARR